MKKILLMTGLLLVFFLMGCSKKDSNKAVENQQEDLQEESDVTEESEHLSEAEDMTESNDEMTSEEEVTEDTEEAGEDLEAEPEQPKEAYMSFKTELGYIGYRGSVDNADWLNCYLLDGYYDGDDFVVNEMTYQYVKDNSYDFYQQFVIHFDASVTIKDDFKLVTQTEEYSIYQDSEANFYASVPAFNNMVISGSIEEDKLKAFISSFTYEGEDNSKDVFNSVTFGNYKFADQIKLSAYSEITFKAAPLLNAFYPLEYILLCNDIEIDIADNMKTKASNNISGDSSKKKINKGDTFPNFNMYVTSNNVFCIGIGDSPSIVLFGFEAQEGYDTIKELLVESKN